MLFRSAAGRHRALQAVQHRRPRAFGNYGFRRRLSFAVNVQQRVQFHQTGGLDPQIVLKGERLSYFLLGSGLLLVKVLQLVRTEYIYMVRQVR